MATTVWKTAATVAAVSNGGVNWSNPSNIGSSNDAYAVASSIPNAGNSYDLRATNFGFTSSDIPTGSTIDGIEVEVEAKADNASRGYISAALRNVTGGTAKRVPPGGGNYLTTSDVTTTLGGASDVWSATVTQANVLNAAFGVNMIANCDSSTVTVSVDFVRLRVHYTPPLDVGRANETDAALALARVQLRAAGRANETDVALALARRAILAVGRGDEADAALALAAIQQLPAGLAQEVSAALALGAARPAGMADETDTALRIVSLAIDLAAETDSALALVGRISAVTPERRTITWPGNRLEDRTITFTRGAAS